MNNVSKCFEFCYYVNVFRCIPRRGFPCLGILLGRPSRANPTRSLRRPNFCRERWYFCPSCSFFREPFYFCRGGIFLCSGWILSLCRRYPCAKPAITPGGSGFSWFCFILVVVYFFSSIGLFFFAACIPGFRAGCWDFFPALSLRYPCGTLR